jgi:hypothetical protein
LEIYQQLVVLLIALVKAGMKEKLQIFQQKKQHCKWTRRGSHDHIKTFERAYITLSMMTKIKIDNKERKRKFIYH